MRVRHTSANDDFMRKAYKVSYQRTTKTTKVQSDLPVYLSRQKKCQPPSFYKLPSKTCFVSLLSLVLLLPWL